MTLFTTETCSYCKQVKKFLDHKGVAYKVQDITNDQPKALELQKLTGAVTVPILVKDNDEFLIGYNPGKLAEFIR